MRGWDDVSRPVDEHGKVVDAHSMSFSEHDQLEAVSPSIREAGVNDLTAGPR